MRIAIDYDAYALDAQLWDRFIDDVKARGCEVICYVHREPGHSIAVSASPAMLLFYIGTQNAHVYCQREGLGVDVWIGGIE